MRESINNRQRVRSEEEAGATVNCNSKRRKKRRRRLMWRMWKDFLLGKKWKGNNYSNLKLYLRANIFGEDLCDLKSMT